MLKTLLCSASIAAMLITVSPARASEEPRTRVVEYGDLDLTSPTGEERLHRRIRAAVNNVCGRAHALNLTEMATFKRCSLATMADVGPKAQMAIAAAANGSRSTRLALASPPDRD